MILNQDLAELAENDLVLLAQGGNAEAFAELVRRTRPTSLRSAHYILKDADAAQDQVQSAYLNAWKQLGNFRSEAKFSSWMARIVTNQCLMALRARRGAPAQMSTAIDDPDLTLEFPDTKPGAEHDLAHEQEFELVRQQLKRVPPFLRRAIELVYYGDFSIADAADQLGVSVPAFKSRLSRARTLLKQRLIESGVAS